MNARLSLALAAFGVLLVACAVPTGGPFLPFATVTSSQSPFYANHLVIGAARNGLMPVVIINNPFGASNVDAVSAVMQGPDWAGTFKFQSCRRWSYTCSSCRRRLRRSHGRYPPIQHLPCSRRVGTRQRRFARDRCILQRQRTPLHRQRDGTASA